MTQALWEVLNDLWKFICHEFLVLSSGQHNLKESSNARVSSSQKTEVLRSRPIVTSGDKSSDLIGWTAYIKVDSVPYFSQPELIFDTKLGSFSYGDKVMVVCSVNNFTEVRTATVQGWVATEALSDDSKQILPVLETGNIYNAHNEQTIKLRRCINDEALGQMLTIPLQSVEFALMALKQRQILISWPAERPRLPGRWKTLLRGYKGVSLSIEPRTGAILEYGGDDGTDGFLGYVEAVHPDLSITLQSVGRVVEGEYRVEEFSHNEWKEWRPVYISFA